MNKPTPFKPKPSTFAASQARRRRIAGVIMLETIRNWNKDNVSRLSAALSCYTLISIAPLVILSVAFAGAIFGEAATRGQVARDASSLVGMKAAQAIENAILSPNPPHSGISSTILGIFVLLLGA